MTTPARMYRRPVVTDVKPEREGRKSRVFRADLLCVVTANRLWELGGSAKEHTVRPVLMAYAATEQESRAFTANLRSGRPAVDDTDRPTKLRFEIPRSAGFQFDTHSQDGGTLTVAYLRWAFALQPADSTHELMRFLCMPPRWWVEREAATLQELGEDASDAAKAAYFVAFLDERSPLPIANDLRFHLELYRAALAADWCRQPDSSETRMTDFSALGYETLGFERPLIVSTSHAQFSDFLAEQTAKHLPRVRQEVPDHGKTRIGGARRLLPDPAGVASQLGLPG
jgi:hypothetical protein